MNEQVLYNRPLFPARLDYSHPLTRGLRACYVCNDTGLRLFDSTVYQKHGTLTGELIRGYHGLIGNASVYVDCGSGTLVLPKRNQITIEMWVDSTEIRVNEDDGVNRNYILYRHAANKSLIFNWWIGGVAKQANTDSNLIEAGKIYHCMATYDGGIGKVFLNGIVGATTEAATGTIDADTVNLAVGAQIGGANPFSGSVHLVRIWDIALNQTDIRNLLSNPYDMFLK